MAVPSSCDRRDGPLLHVSRNLGPPSTLDRVGDPPHEASTGRSIVAAMLSQVPRRVLFPACRAAVAVSPCGCRVVGALWWLRAGTAASNRTIAGTFVPPVPPVPPWPFPSLARTDRWHSRRPLPPRGRHGTMFEKQIVIDARGHMMGRLSSIVAKELLNGRIPPQLGARRPFLRSAFLKLHHHPPLVAKRPWALLSVRAHVTGGVFLLVVVGGPFGIPLRRSLRRPEGCDCPL